MSCQSHLLKTFIRYCLLLNNNMLYIRRIILIFVIAFLGGCVLHPAYDKAAVVIYNNTPHSLSYSVYSTDTWSEPVNLKSQDADFAMLYDIISNDATPPEVFNKIKIVTPGCNIVLDRKALESHFVRDPDGRKGWNLYINEKLPGDSGCK